MKHSNHAYLGGGVIIAIMALAVFTGGAKACHHDSETVEQTSIEPSQEANEKTEFEV